MVKLSSFGVTDLMALRSRIRSMFAAHEPASFEEAAARLVSLLRNELTDDYGGPACALVRVYKTHPFGELPRDLQGVAQQSTSGGVELQPHTRCLVLMATAGEEPAWNSRHASRGHKAIPLDSEAAVAAAPMVSQLIQQLGVDVATVLHPDPGMLLQVPAESQTVFYVPQAAGSPHIPAQREFVMRYGIQSVLGFGGLLTSGDLVAAILFSKVPISPEVADHFKVVGLNVKLSLLPWVVKPLFGSDAAAAT